MSNIIVFEGHNEIIIGDANNINDIIKEWFLEGQRNLDDYDRYLIDGREGTSFNTQITLNHSLAQYDVTELMPNQLREDLIDAGLLTEE